MKIICFFLILSGSISATSQELLKRGFIVLNSGDSAMGYIRDEEWEISPTKINFQKDANGPVEELTPDNIQGFFTARQVYYESGRFKYDGDVKRVNQLPESREPSKWIEGEFFLETIIKSNCLSLYEFTDEHGQIHYLFRNGLQEPEELLYRTYKATINGSVVIVTSHQWKQQLLNLTKDNPSIVLANKINSSPFNAKNLKSIIQLYNRSVGEKIYTLTNTTLGVDRKKSSYGLMAELFTSRVFINIADSEFNNLNYGAGIFYEAFSKRKPNRLSIYNELKFLNVKLLGSNSASSTGVDIKMQGVYLSNLVRQVVIIKRDFNLFVELGMVNGYRINTVAKNQVNNFDHASGSETGLVNGIALGMGSNFNLFNLKSIIDLRYDYDTEPFKATTYVGSHRIGIVWGIRF